MLELPPDLDGLIDLALRVDSRLQQGGQRSRHLRDFALPEYSPTNSDDAISHPPGGEPMQVGRARLSREEREHRRRRGLCIYCGTAGHFLAECPVKGQARQRIWGCCRVGISLNKTSANTLLPVRLQWAARSQECKALVDSGLKVIFGFSFARHLHIPIVTLDHRIVVKALNGQSLPPVTHSTTPVTLITSGNHTERIIFFSHRLSLSTCRIGPSWLTKHKSRIDWGQSSVAAWSESCYASCLVSACSPVSCSPLQDEAVNLSNVPAEYHDLKEVFSKSRAASLPPPVPMTVL